MQSKEHSIKKLIKPKIIKFSDSDFKNYSSYKENNKLEQKIKENYKDLGELEICPYCNKKFEKIPMRTSKCKFCNNKIYRRTRPLDRKYVLIREDQKEDLNNQWTLYNKEKEEIKLMEHHGFISAKKYLLKKYKKEPNINNIQLRVLNKERIRHAYRQNWKGYIHIRNQMAYLLQKEKKFKQALKCFLEIYYLYIICNNSKKWFSKEEIYDYRIEIFKISPYPLNSDIIKNINNLISELNLSKEKTKELFCSKSNKIKPIKNLPVLENKIWKKLLKEIKIN